LNPSVTLWETPDTQLKPRESSEVAAAKNHQVQWAQVIVLAILYVTPVFFALRIDQVTDTDVWWHLRSGEWVFLHRAVPQTEPFSSIGAGQPWVAYSWLFELTIFLLFKKLGLLGIVLYTSTMVLATTIAVHRVIRRLNSDFTITAAMTLLAIYCMGRILTPRSWLFSILLFALELGILVDVRQSGKNRNLLWLPLIFVVWANVHVEFADGLLILGIALAEALIAARWRSVQTRFRPAWMAGIFLASVMATLVNPYGWRIYKAGFDQATQMGVLNPIIEFSAISFRNLDDWCLLFLALASVALLTRSRKLQLFEVVLIAVSIFFSFHAQRDIWMLAIAGSAVIASQTSGTSSNPLCLKTPALVLSGVLALFCLVITLRIKQENNADLQVKLTRDLPVAAVDAIRQQGWRGPLYNDFNWGGFLIWWLRMPVSMDGRTNVYGNERIMRSYATWSGYPGWDSDADLVRANLILAPVGAPLTQLLDLQPCLQTAYHDNLAVIFVPRSASAENSSVAISRFCAARQAASH
jgi:hypothetical protein